MSWEGACGCGYLSVGMRQACTCVPRREPGDMGQNQTSRGKQGNPPGLSLAPKAVLISLGSLGRWERVSRGMGARTNQAETEHKHPTFSGAVKQQGRPS